MAVSFLTLLNQNDRNQFCNVLLNTKEFSNQDVRKIKKNLIRNKSINRTVYFYLLN
jgi:hypothetical protein